VLVKSVAWTSMVAMGSLLLEGSCALIISPRGDTIQLDKSRPDERKDT
jgi:hypothetical protein